MNEEHDQNRSGESTKAREYGGIALVGLVPTAACIVAHVRSSMPERGPLTPGEALTMMLCAVLLGLASAILFIRYKTWGAVLLGILFLLLNAVVFCWLFLEGFLARAHW